MANGQLYALPACPADPVAWWGIYNEPNINNNLTPEQYVTLFNTVVPAMQAIDPSIKIVGLELADYAGQEAAWVPPFVSGVTAQGDVMATHFYSTCNQKDSDATVFQSVPEFVTDVEATYSTMATNPALVSVPFLVYSAFYFGDRIDQVIKWAKRSEYGILVLVGVAALIVAIKVLRKRRARPTTDTA